MRVPKAERRAAAYDAINEPAERAGVAALRHDLLSEACGATIEIGAGTGLNLAHYPASVTRLVLAEPDDHMRARLEAKLAGSPRRAEVRSDRAEAISAADGAFDTAVCTLVLCTVPHPGRALSEIRRVLTPGGRLLVLEHVRAASAGVALMQHAVSPLYRLLAGGCRPDRATGSSISAAGFTFEWQRREVAPATPRLERELLLGVARRW